MVEDEERIATFIQRGLEEEGYAVDVAYDGRDGLKRACEGVYDLLVLDLMLPKLDGFELLKRLRAENHDMPVLVLTAGIDTQLVEDSGLKQHPLLWHLYSFYARICRKRCERRSFGPMPELPLLRSLKHWLSAA